MFLKIVIRILKVDIPLNFLPLQIFLRLIFFRTQINHLKVFQNLIGLEERRKQIQKIQTNIRRSRYNPEEVGGLHHFHVFPSVLDAGVTV